MKELRVKDTLSVAFFAFFGGICRYLMGLWMSSTGTLIVNILGSFLLALLTYYATERQDFSEWLTVGLGTGFIGAFTTFSSFTTDFWKLYHQSAMHAFCYLGGSIIGAFFAVCIGMVCGIGLAKRQRIKRGERP